MFSCRRRSKALSRSVDGGEPYGISSRAAYGRSMSPGVIGSTVLPHRYDAKSMPGNSSTRVSCGCASNDPIASYQYCGMSSSRSRLAATMPPVNKRRQRDDRRAPSSAEAHRPHEPRRRAGERRQPEAEEHGEAERDQRHGPRRAPQRQALVAVEQVLPPLPGERRVVPRVRADGDEDAGEHERREVGAVLPTARSWPPTSASDRQQVGDGDEPEPLRVVDARLDPRPEAIAAVEEPVAEARAATRVRPRPMPRPPRSRCTAGSGCRSRSAPTGPRSTTATSAA